MPIHMFYNNIFPCTEQWTSAMINIMFSDLHLHEELKMLIFLYPWYQSASEWKAVIRSLEEFNCRSSLETERFMRQVECPQYVHLDL